MTVHPDYDPIPYTGVFQLGDRIYRVGLHHVIETSSDNGDSWTSLTPSGPQFNILQVAASGNYALCLLDPMRFAPEDWEDSTHTSVMLFRKDRLEPTLLQVPWFVKPKDLDRKMNVDATGDALFISQVGEQQVLLRSSDEGVSWQPIPIPDSLGDRHFPYFIDRDRGILVSAIPGDGRTAAVYVTHDAGATWNNPGIHTALPSTGYLSRVPPLTWLSKDTVFLIDESNATLLSTDGGLHWSVQSDNTTLPIIDCLTMDHTGVGYYSCEDGAVYRVEEYGRSSLRVRDKSYTELPQRIELCSPEPDRIICVNRYGGSFYSRDGGLTWIDEKFQSLYFPKDLQLLSDQTAYVHLFPTDRVMNNGLYLVTDNGGESWKTAYDIDQAGKDWLYIHIATPSVWYAVRKPDQNDSTVLLRTSDAGVLWKPVFARTINYPLINLWQGTFSVGEDTLWFPCSDGLFATHDGGETWAHLEVDMGNTAHGALDISDYPHCYMLSGNKVAVSSDAGTTWRYFENGGDLYNPRILISANKTAYLHFREKGTWRWNLLKSTNAGISWDSIDVIQQQVYIGNIDAGGNSYGMSTISSQAFLSTTDEWRNTTVEGELYGRTVGGIYSRSYNISYAALGGSIIKTTNGGINWTKVTPSLPQSPRIISTWPQPVSQGGMMSTEVELTRPGFVRIELYDLLGRRRAVVWDAEVAATRRTVQWSTAGLERGVYVLRLVTGSGAANTKVMVK